MKIHKLKFEDVIREFFEYYSWGSPKQILRFATARLGNRYYKDTLRRKIQRILKKKYIRHPYFPIYFSKPYDLQVFNFLLRLGWFRVAFEIGDCDPVYGSMPEEWADRIQKVRKEYGLELSSIS